MMVNFICVKCITAVEDHNALHNRIPIIKALEMLCDT